MREVSDDEIVIRLPEMPSPQSLQMNSNAAVTRSKFAKGSPMPMNTTLLMRPTP